MTAKRAKTVSALLAALMLTLACAGCINVRPQYNAQITPGPTGVPSVDRTEEPEPTEEPTSVPTEEDPALASETVDAMGSVITGADHFYRYIKFTDLVVYEEDGDTFLDGIALNSYSQPLVCAVSIVYRDEGGGELARSQLQTRDGNYMLILAPGENVVFAHILTDMSLVGLEYTLEFDTTSGVHPA